MKLLGVYAATVAVLLGSNVFLWDRLGSAKIKIFELETEVDGLRKRTMNFIEEQTE